jgi:hypothetical protein
MPVQYVYLNTEAVKGGLNPSAYVLNENEIKINLGGMFSDIPPYVKISIIQCEVRSLIELSPGVVICSDVGASNYRSLANTGTCLAILPDESKQAGVYHYVLSDNEKPEYIIYGNLEQFSIFFNKYDGTRISLTETTPGTLDQTFGMIFKLETPAQNEIVSNYRRSIPY